MSSPQWQVSLRLQHIVAAFHCWPVSSSQVWELCHSEPHYLRGFSLTSRFQCAGCGEWNETVVDSSAGTRQSYVEDCQTCCKPNVLLITWDMAAGEYAISAQLE